MKKLILVTSPPACGKTYISKKLAERLDHIVYLDKDTLIPLSKRIFAAAGEKENRSSKFFEDNIRDVEYDVILRLALDALNYDDKVLINAPFTREVRNKNFMDHLKALLKKKNARLCVVWVRTDIEVCHQRMISRNSPRDTEKLANWEKYVADHDWTIPQELDDPDIVDDLLVFNNSNDEEFAESMDRIAAILEADI